MNNALKQSLSKLLADTYALYLKTQNYHWHVKGPHFKPLHELFEAQYQDLANAVDLIAERILTLGEQAPATFTAFNQLTSIQDGDSKKSPNDMLNDLHNDHEKVVNDLNDAIALAQKENDEGTASLLSDRVAEHEKMRWMLGASSS